MKDTEALKAEDTEHVKKNLEFLKASVKINMTEDIIKPMDLIRKYSEKNVIFLRLERIISFISIRCLFLAQL